MLGMPIRILGPVGVCQFNRQSGSPERLAKEVGVPNLRGTPNYWDRSWPMVRDDMGCVYIQEKIDEMIEYGALNKLSFISSEGLREISREHKSREERPWILTRPTADT